MDQPLSGSAQMTPLAHSLAKLLTFPIKERPPYWRERSSQLADFLCDVHCFEVTQILPLMQDMADAAPPAEFFDGRIFLPAPKTWIEANSDGRVGILLDEGPNKCAATAWIFRDDGIALLGHIDLKFPQIEPIKQDSPLSVRWPLSHLDLSDEDAAAYLATCHYALAVINSPKIIGRRQHMPHKGLEKRLRDQLGPVGKYPLHAWQEIVLEAKPTFVDESGQVHEAHLTGRKCLHFCRAHVRIRDGKMEIVNSHWRGDPALGIKRSRYKVIPPTRGNRSNSQ